MCDNILASPDTTSNSSMLFGKNSDRQTNEAHVVELHRGREHADDARVTCTYISIPQVRRTHSVLLCRPFWIWGAEMGANDQGVVLGNEGIHSRLPPPMQEALTGMDLLRLTLERCSSAAQGVEIITSLLREYGQGGNCGHLEAAYYNNGFMIADAKDAFVIETIGREWIVERISGTRSMSNAFSIGRGVYAKSAGIPRLLERFGWLGVDEPDYSALIADGSREHIGNAGARRARSSALLSAQKGRINAAHMMRVLRDHQLEAGVDDEVVWGPDCLDRRTLCMHAGTEDRPGQTVGSIVSELRIGTAIHWVTASSAPCISIFKPVLIDVKLPSHGPPPTGSYDPATFWWRHERFYRTALLWDFEETLREIHEERQALEASFRLAIKEGAGGGGLPDWARIIAECWNEAMDLEHQWCSRITSKDAKPTDWPHAPTWRKMNQIAGLEL